MHFLERFLQRPLDRLELLPCLDVAGTFQQQIKADDLVGQRLAGLVVELARYSLSLALLRLQDTLRADVAFVLQPVEHGVKNRRDPSQVRIRKVGMDPRFIDSRLHGAHGGLQLAYRLEGEPQDQKVGDQDGDQPDREQPHQERQPRAPGEIQRDQRATDGAGGNDGAVGHNHLLKGGQVPMPPPRVQRGSHSSF